MPGPISPLVPGTLLTRRPGNFTPAPPPANSYVALEATGRIALESGSGLLVREE